METIVQNSGRNFLKFLFAVLIFEAYFIKMILEKMLTGRQNFYSVHTVVEWIIDL